MQKSSFLHTKFITFNAKVITFTHLEGLVEGDAHTKRIKRVRLKEWVEDTVGHVPDVSLRWCLHGVHHDLHGRVRRCQREEEAIPISHLIAVSQSTHVLEPVALYLLRWECIHNLDPESGANCGFCCVYIFPGVDTTASTSSTDPAASFISKINTSQ